jgi:serine/threonine protein kinase
MQSNATDVTTQFLAELRVYTTLARHRNITAFLGCLENVGMVLEFVDGRTLYDVLREHEKRFVDAGREPAQAMGRDVKVDYHDQLLAGLTHLHAYGLSHGDLSLLNIQVTHAPGNTVKLLDFGRSVAADSVLRPPDEEPADPFARIPQQHQQYGNSSSSNAKHSSSSTTPTMSTSGRQPLVEQIHPGTRPFAAPEVLRGECTDARLADAYSFGMILVCLDRCTAPGLNKSWTLEDVKPWTQRRDQLPTGFFDGCVVFGTRAQEWYVRPWTERKRLLASDEIGSGDVDMG